MKIILAPDKFKGTLSGLEFCEVVSQGIQSVNNSVEISWLPLADGGDGTIEVVKHYLQGELVKTKVHNPFFRIIDASYLISKDKKTAFIEMAEASGLKLLKHNEYDCKNATTLGTGELVLHALGNGVETIIFGVGGSATNDGGMGMATALGYKFLDENGDELKPIGMNLSKIKHIDSSDVISALKAVDFQIACDVTNPLYGIHGAAHVYAKQKGASPEDIQLLDAGLKHFSEVVKIHFEIENPNFSGAGAAGGMGLGSKVFLNGNLNSGIEIIKEVASFNKHLLGTDWIITGEGMLDTQTESGKVVSGVCTSAKKQQIPVAAFCGAIDLEASSVEKMGIHYCDSVLNHAKSQDDAMKNPKKYVEKMARKFIQACLDSKE